MLSKTNKLSPAFRMFFLYKTFRASSLANETLREVHCLHCLLASPYKGLGRQAGQDTACVLIGAVCAC